MICRTTSSIPRSVNFFNNMATAPFSALIPDAVPAEQRGAASGWLGLMSVLGNFVGDIAPRFVRRYAEVGAQVERAFSEYARDVRASVFPGPEHCYQIDAADEALIRAARQTPAPAVGATP